MTRNDEGMIGAAEAAYPALPRRSVLAGAGAGMAGLAAAAVLGGGAPALASTTRAPADSRAARQAAKPGRDEAIVVHVRDIGTGEIDVFRGTAHARISDRQLAAQLARAIK